MARPGDIERRGPDLTVYAPAAIKGLSSVKNAMDITPADVIQMQEVELRILREELEKQKIAAATITRFAVCCMYVILQHTGEDVVAIDRELYEKLSGAEIQLAHWQNSEIGPVFGRYLEKAPPDNIGG